MAIDIERLRHASMLLSDVIADPARWADLLEDIAAATGAMGAGLLPRAGSEGALSTRSLRECLETYIREGWPEADRESHRRALELQMRGEVATDRELVAHGDGGAPFFDEFLPRFEGKWWAGIGFRSGSDLWSLTLHRSSRQGPFQRDDTTVLQQFALRLNEVGGLAYLAGRVTLSTVAMSFDQIGKAVVAIDATGKVIHANAAAERLLGTSVRIAGGRLAFGDRNAAAEYGRIVERLRRTREGKTLGAPPVIVRRRDATPLVIRLLPVDGAAKSPFLHARALLLLNEIGRPARSDGQIFSRAFGLTPAEARLAARLATGESLESIAEALGITKETARSRIKIVFQKTDCHRQADLVALLASLT